MIHLQIGSRLLACALVLFLLAARTPAARAEAAPHETQSVSAPEHSEKKLDAAYVSGLSRYDLGLWTLIVFGLLFLILGKFAWKPIMEGLQKREDTIAAHHAAAESARKEAEEFLAEIKKQRSQAHEEIAALLATARKDAESFRESEIARTNQDIHAERDRLKREIDTAQAMALQDIWEKTVQLSVMISMKSIGRSVTEEDHRRLIAESMDELKAMLGSARK